MSGGHGDLIIVSKDGPSPNGMEIHKKRAAPKSGPEFVVL
jgi:hypothetical protein